MSIKKQPRNSNLPADVTSFVGRTDEMRRIRSVLSHARLLSLTGAGGVGKTRLARAVGADMHRAFRDGVWLIDLTTVPDGGFAEQAIRDAAPGPRNAASVEEQLADRESLLVLDNLDYVGADIGQRIADILAHCPDIRILTTTRSALGISGEYVLQVRPFAVAGNNNKGDSKSSDAVTLFRHRAQAVTGLGPVDWNDSELLELCSRLEGLPLAIELAALRTRSMSIREIIDGLKDRFRLLKGGPRDLPRRHRSLTALLQWSWDQCNLGEQRLWAYFSVFAGSATLDAIVAICGSTTATAHPAELVESLVQRSILVCEYDEGVSRFRMLDSMREFGLLMLSGEDRNPNSWQTNRVRSRHMEYYLGYAADAEKSWFGPNQRKSSTGVGKEIANIRVAFEHALDDSRTCGLAASVVADLWFYWIGCGHLHEGKIWAERAWTRVNERGVQSEARTLWTLGWILLITGEVDRADWCLGTCLASAGRENDSRSAAFATALLGAVHGFRGDAVAALASYQSAVDDARSRGDQMATAIFLYQQAEMYCVFGYFDQAEESCNQCAEICLNSGDRWCLAYMMWVRSLIHFMKGETESSGTLADEALSIMATVEDHLGVTLVGELLAWIATADGEFPKAAALLAATGAYWGTAGSPLMGFDRLHRHRETSMSRLTRELSNADVARATAEGLRAGVEGIPGLARPSHDELNTPSTLARKEQTHPSQSDVHDAYPGLAGLTNRERQIAGLIAQGMTNKQIASSLIISRRTVDTHVAHILAKCGAQRRSEIASLITSESVAR
ncbi:hypothetical protein R1CP_36750 (plasmid) [Rhodococcus opacus]|uniref:HTH luxR-type domain-containing protein n=1 Tax=Rhodococcus opacus TaxID=37919 RepID=A0A1B1KH68_RHOOP|nr:LuxR C-terminal-related transcriptional regulator [Rhodococcus opacus]ANS31956.1 hypothetical protein R1CP_36750 [Rhodococcus opacus]